MRHSRPINLNLFTIHFPLPAIVSILHRISGFILFFMIPLVLWVLSYSLTEQGFATMQGWLDQFYVQFLVWLLFIPFFFHLVAGIRHLFSDIHLGDTLPLGWFIALLTFVITFILIILAGIWLW